MNLPRLRFGVASRWLVLALCLLVYATLYAGVVSGSTEKSPQPASAPAHALRATTATASVDDCTTSAEYLADLALLLAEPDGGTLIFACGAGAHTLNLAASATIDRPITIDANGLDITLVMTTPSTHFVIDSSGALTLVGINLQGGFSFSGGSIRA